MLVKGPDYARRAGPANWAVPANRDEILLLIAWRILSEGWENNLAGKFIDSIWRAVSIRSYKRFQDGPVPSPAMLLHEKNVTSPALLFHDGMSTTRAGPVIM